MRRPRPAFAILLGLLLVASLAPVAPVRAVPGSITGFSLDPPSVSHIGNGTAVAVRPDTMTFETSDAYQSTTPEWVFLKMFGITGTAGEGHWWYVNLAAPPGEDLEVGTYTGAVRAASRQAGEPGIDIYGDGAGCEPLPGTASFTVHEIAFDGDALDRFAATYEFTCGANPVSQTYYGEVRYQSTIDFKAITLTPQRREFPDRLTGTTSSAATTSIRNRGTVPLTIASTTLGGDDAEDFEVVSPCTAVVLGPGASCALTYRFAPDTVGDRTATITVDDDTQRGEHVITLTGTGIDPVAGISMDQPILDFGSRDLGTTSPNQVTTLTSTGTVPLDIDTVTLGGTHAADFKLIGQTCTAAPIAVGATCTVTTAFSPKTAGARNAVVTIDHNVAFDTSQITLSGTGLVPVSDVAWGTTTAAGPAYTWNFGASMASTTATYGTYFNAIYATNRVSSQWVDDNGPYMGVYAIRSTNASTWGTPVRLNPTNQHAERPSLAATGNLVYATWVSQTKYDAYSPTAARVLYVRVNVRQGASDSWRSSVRLTSTTGRVDYPIVAASGNNAYVVFTDSVTGSVRMARTTDRGLTWTTTTLGSTTDQTSDGFQADPTVAASGTTVVVAWTSAPGTARMRVSSTSGASFAAAVNLSTTASSTLGVAALGDRAAATWAQGRTVKARVWQAGVLAPATTATTFLSSASTGAYSPSVALRGTASIAVAATSLVPSDFSWEELYWVESTTNGTVWYGRQRIATTTSSTRRANDWPSIHWASGGTRYILWNGWTADTSNYRLYIRKGTGSP